MIFNKVINKMIRIRDKSQDLTLFFNKLNNQNTHICNLILTGIGEEKYLLGDFEDLDNYEDYYVLQLNLSNLPDGEYKWCINNYEQGLLIIGDLTNNTISPNDVDTYKQDQTNKEYIQYEG